MTFTVSAPATRPSTATDEVGAQPIPLVVDVDGTLIKTDLLFEAAVQLMLRQPWQVGRLSFVLARGKAEFKKALADCAQPISASLPLCTEVVSLIKRAQFEGRPVYLASASERRFVEPLAQRIGGIERVFATEGQVNLGGRAKAARLIEEFGEGKFDYVGNASIDFHVWEAARRVYALTASNSFERRLLERFPHAEVVVRSRPRARYVFEALRTAEWLRNAVVFVPVLLQNVRSSLLAEAVILFLSLSLAWSGARVLTDVCRLAVTRADAAACNEPIACGAISIPAAFAMCAVLVLAALCLGALVSPVLSGLVGLYFLVAAAHLLAHGHVVAIATLTAVYTLAIEAATLISDDPPPLVRAFYILLFVYLAVSRRRADVESKRAGAWPATHSRVLRGVGVFALGCSFLLLALHFALPAFN